MKNYYFKFQKENAGFDKLFNSKSPYNEALKLLQNNTNIPLSIYYGKWKINEKEDGIKNIRRIKNLEGNDYNRSISQIELFFNLKNENNNIYFWSFYKDIIMCFKPDNLEVIDGPDEFKDLNGSLPKSIICKIKYIFRKIDLPEIFSNINSNQRYNRGTISELVGFEKEVAEKLIDNGNILINDNNLLNYLSPMEFETLLFMIFSNEKVLCSSYRGGTLKDYDLRIKVSENYFGIPQGIYWIQVKMKNKISINRSNDIYYVYLGKSNIDNKIIGYDWIIERISENNIIKKWLKEMVYNYEVFNIS